MAVRLGKTVVFQKDETTGRTKIKPRGRRLSVSEIIRQQKSKKQRVVRRAPG